MGQLPARNVTLEQRMAPELKYDCHPVAKDGRSTGTAVPWQAKNSNTGAPSESEGNLWAKMPIVRQLSNPNGVNLRMHSFGLEEKTNLVLLNLWPDVGTVYHHSYKAL